MTLDLTSSSSKNKHGKADAVAIARVSKVEGFKHVLISLVIKSLYFLFILVDLRNHIGVSVVDSSHTKI